jgi:hypothetical protein
MGPVTVTEIGLPTRAPAFTPGGPQRGTSAARAARSLARSVGTSGDRLDIGRRERRGDNGAHDCDSDGEDAAAAAAHQPGLSHSGTQLSADPPAAHQVSHHTSYASELAELAGGWLPNGLLHHAGGLG